MKLFFQSISWNTISGAFHKPKILSCNTFTLVSNFHCVCFPSIKNLFPGKRYRVKFMLLIKQKQKNSKIPKRIWMKPCLKTRSEKSACANIFLEHSLTNSVIILEWMQHHAIDHSLTFIHWLLIHLILLTLITYFHVISKGFEKIKVAGFPHKNYKLAISVQLKWPVSV